MRKISESLGSLKKSTKITLMSCGSFVLMTALILCFFVMFPITPSEKMMSSISREAVSTNANGDNIMTAMPAVETTVSGEETVTTTAKATTTKVTASTTRTNYTITVTTGSGFLWGGAIPTGIMPGGSTQTTASDYSQESSDEPQPTYPITGNGDEPIANTGTGLADPNQGTGYVDPNQGTGYVDPNQGTGYVDPNQGGAVDPNQGTGYVDPNQGGAVDPNTGGDPNSGGYVDPNTGGDPNSGVSDPNTGYVDPNQGSVDPGTGGGDAPLADTAAVY